MTWAYGFKIIKSDNTLISWNCQLYHSGPHYWIFKCRFCKFHMCRPYLDEIKNGEKYMIGKFT
ncbi:hypothetical protein B0H63DRAFT_405396 [Podospora didyma]|uniref:Uncharacterized protein n=1 Tax=Podospora didyma TaxID=330526 RepID=A0AAE0JY18_9PEZI|nr:hypothetical protein B0H63DRAFT_405396 [Podospora didyma]